MRTIRIVAMSALLLWLPAAAPAPPDHGNGATASEAAAPSELSFEKRTHERKLREARSELETVRQSRARVGSYQSWVFGLGIALIVFGLITGCAQLAGDPWNKRVTTVAAALVVAVTAFKTSYYPMESQAIAKLVSPADDAIQDQARFLELYSEELKSDSPDTSAIRDYLNRVTGNQETFLQVNEALRAAGLSLGLAAPPAKADKAGKKTGMLMWWQMPVVMAAGNPSAGRESASGTGQCNDPKAAREYARYTALEGLARLAIKGERRADLDSVIEFLGEEALLEKFHSSQAVNGFTTYDITYSVPSQVLERAGLQVGTKNREAFIEWANNTVTVTRQELGSKGVKRVVVPLLSTKSTMGINVGVRKFFDVHLGLTPVSGSERVAVQLMQADTFHDGSTGSTRWAFEVAVNGRPVISFPNHRFNDNRNPTVCVVPASEEARRRGEAELADRLAVKVTAYSPR